MISLASFISFSENTVMIGSDRPSPCVLLSQPAIPAELTCHPRNSQLLFRLARLTGRRAGGLQRRVGMHFKHFRWAFQNRKAHRASVKIRVILAQLAEGAEGVQALLGESTTTACDTAALPRPSYSHRSP